MAKIGIKTSAGLVPFSGSSGGGHTIVDDSGTSMTQRSNLKFVGATITDDATNDMTIVETGGGVTPMEITVTTLPNKTSYSAGDLLDLTGLRVDMLFTDGSVRDITADAVYTPAEGTALTMSNTSVTVTYASYTKSFNITVTPPIYGVEWDGTSTTVWSRTDKAENFADPNPYYSGMTTTPSSPFDNISPWKDMVKSERTGGTMVSIPKFYYKWTKSGTIMKLQIVPGEYASWATAHGFSISPAHMNRGDGKGERDVVYVGRYHCSSSNYKSASGVTPKVSMTRADFRTNIHNLGSTIWQNDYATRLTIQMLYLVEFADWNSQNKIGGGCSATTASSSAVYNMGYTDSMPYHTGTVSSSISRTVYGGTQYRYIEGLWDNCYDWCDGIYFSSANIYAIKNPANFSDTANGTLVGTRPKSSNYISEYDFSSVEGFEYFLYPSAVSGSESTYISDYCFYSSSGVVLRVGGYYDQSQGHGLFCLNGNGSASYSSGNVGSRLLELP